MKTGKVILGVLAGVAIGGIIGILLAPEKGSITRRRMMYSGSDFEDDIEDELDENLEPIKSKFKSARNEAEEIIEKGKEKFEEVRKDIKNKIA